MVMTGPHAVSSESDPLASGDNLSLLKPVNVLLREWRAVVWTVVTTVILGAASTLWSGAPYVANSLVTPTVSGSADSRFSTLAAQFGFNVGAAGATPSIGFYADVLKSEELLRTLALTEYRFALDRGGADSTTGNFLEIAQIDDETEVERLQTAVDLLRKQIRVGQDPDAATLGISVSAPYAELAEQMNRRALDLLNDFNLSKRSSQAGAERKFVEQRLEAARRELDEWEEELRRFLEANRSYAESPRLSFEADRLQRRVNLHQQVVTTLSQAYEQARIDEVRDTPVITVVDAPEGSARRILPLLRNLVVAIVLGLFAGAVLAFSREYLRAQRQFNPEDYAEFTTLWGDMTKRLRWRRHGRESSAA